MVVQVFLCADLSAVTALVIMSVECLEYIQPCIYSNKNFRNISYHQLSFS